MKALEKELNVMVSLKDPQGDGEVSDLPTLPLVLINP